MNIPENEINFNIFYDFIKTYTIHNISNLNFDKTTIQKLKNDFLSEGVPSTEILFKSYSELFNTQFLIVVHQDNSSEYWKIKNAYYYGEKLDEKDTKTDFIILLNNDVHYTLLCNIIPDSLQESQFYIRQMTTNIYHDIIHEKYI